MAQPNFDAAAGHRHFSADAFNRTWELIDKPDRTPKENEQMLLRAAASLWHWTQREDVTAENLSVGFWPLSRVHAIAGSGLEAVRYARLALRESEKPGVAPFCRAYAHEALARGEAAAGRAEASRSWLDEARKAAALVPDEEARAMVLTDLATIPGAADR